MFGTLHYVVCFEKMDLSIALPTKLLLRSIETQQQHTFVAPLVAIVNFRQHDSTITDLTALSSVAVLVVDLLVVSYHRLLTRGFDLISVGLFRMQ